MDGMESMALLYSLLRSLPYNDGRHGVKGLPVVISLLQSLAYNNGRYGVKGLLVAITAVIVLQRGTA